MYISTGVSAIVYPNFPFGNLDQSWPPAHMLFHLWSTFFSQNSGRSELISQSLSLATVHVIFCRASHQGGICRKTEDVAIKVCRERWKTELYFGRRR